MKWRRQKAVSPGDLQVVDKFKQRTQSLLAAALGALLVGLIYHTAADADYDDADAKALRVCRLPDANGAMTVFVMENDKIKCWRWR